MVAMKDKIPSHIAWFIVGFSFVTLALVYGIWYSFSVFFVALLKEFGWSRSLGGGAFSLFIIISAIISPFVGNRVSSAEPRRVILVGALILGVGLALCSFTQTWWQFYIFFSVITAVGLGATGWVPHVTIIQSWFKEKRGLPMGIISSGIGIGILVCIPSIQYLIIGLGWRTAYRIMAIFIPLVIVSMAIIVLKRRPQGITYHPEIGSRSTFVKDPLIVNEEWVSQTWTVRRAVTTRPFWFLSLALLLANVITHSIFAHQVAFFVDRGLEPLFASYIVGIVGIVSIGSKILWGVLSDRIGREMTYAMGITCSIIGIIFLILIDYRPSPILAYFFATFFGMGYAVTAALPPLITADFFEGRAYGSIFGSLMIFIGIGGALGAWFAGFLYDQVGNYLPVFVILIGCALFSSLNIWWAAPRRIRRVPGKRLN
jgi:MFS family permease